MKFRQPGAEFYGLTLVFIPISMAAAIMRKKPAVMVIAPDF
jgi:hypothetical protein